MDTQHPRSEFTDVDQSNTPQGYVQCMDFQHSTVFVQMYKQPTRSLLDLQPGLRVLDAGSGTGEDAREIAKLVSPTGQVIGLDFSQTMLDVAQQRTQGMNLPVSFCQGDIHKLPFADNTFDRCYADKTFQHLPYPKQALSELIRVLKPRGRLVVVDPDHDTHVLDTPYPDVTGRFFRFRSDGTQQPGIAHQQYALFREGVIQEMQTRMKVTDSLEGFSQPGDDSWDREGDLPPQPFDLWTRTNVGENLPCAN
jgi:ubiquinone/menaquinone biosynthesis C-methylase UbiE